jgi:type IV secretion system protein VirB10
MKTLVLIFLSSLAAAAQVDINTPVTPVPELKPRLKKTVAVTPEMTTIPAGTKIPVALKHAISTKSAREGDPVYAQTTFPLAIDGKIIIPAGTYVQGKIMNVKRPGRVKGRGELMMHFTSLIFPSGYTVPLPGALDQIPGQENSRMKGDEGTVQSEGSKGKDAKTVANTTWPGAAIGGAAGGGKGALIGAGAGSAAGLAAVLLTRGPDLRIEQGTAVDMVFQREIALDLSRAH